MRTIRDLLEGRRAELAFLGRFALFFFLPYGLLHLVDVSPLTNGITSFLASALNQLSIPTTSQGSLLFVQNSPTVYEIIADCTGLVMVILLFALLYATRLNHRKRLLALAAFSPLLLLFNLARLAATLLVGVWFGFLALEAVHVLLWFVDSGVVLLAWARAADVRLL